MFWITILALLTGVILFTLRPLMAGASRPDSLDEDVALYEASRAELARQRDRGEITEDEFAASDAEQARRLLALSRTERKARKAPDIAGRKVAAAVALLGLPAFSLALYSGKGSPHLPDQPLAARVANPAGFDLALALERIETHLARNPNDGRGYEVVAPVYLRTGRFRDAAFAFRRTIELLGENAARLSGLGESLVADAGGVVTAEARERFRRALALDSTHGKSRFYLAIGRDQDGDRDGALAELRALEESLEDGPSRMRVRDEITRLSGAEKGKLRP